MDFSTLRCILLMYNAVSQQFDKIGFASISNTIIATLTLNDPINIIYLEPPELEINLYQLAGIFTGDLDYLANFLGNQGVLAK